LSRYILTKLGFKICFQMGQVVYHYIEAHKRKANDLKLEIEALAERRERDVRLHGKLTAESEAQGRRLSERAKYLAEMVGRHPEIGPLPAAIAAAAAAAGAVAGAAAGAGAVTDDTAAGAGAEEVRGRAHGRLNQLRGGGGCTAVQFSLHIALESTW
jgi:anti-sigma factor RsiW